MTFIYKNKDGRGGREFIADNEKDFFRNMKKIYYEEASLTRSAAYIYDKKKNSIIVKIVNCANYVCIPNFQIKKKIF